MNIFYYQHVGCFEIPDVLKHVQVSMKQFLKKVEYGMSANDKSGIAR